MGVNKKVVGMKARQEKKPENRYSFRMKHYNKDGKDHYLIIKKPESTEETEVEDIFEDWRACALDNIEDRKRQRTPRVRKLSHRQQRKEMLRDDTTPSEGPMLYSDMLKKNLKFRPNNAPVEDIFEAWRDYLQELDDLLSYSLPSSTASSRHTSGDSDNEVKLQNAKQEQIAESSENILETAMVYQKELHTCGQPTVKTTYDNNNERINKTDVLKSFSIPVQVCGMPPFRNCGSGCGNQKEVIEDYEKVGKMKKMDSKKKQRIMKYQPEIYFAGWRHNFPDNSDEIMYRRQCKKNRYETEEIFRGWRRNFYVREGSEWEEEITEKRKRKQMQPKMMPEKIFNEWLHNFYGKQRRLSKKGSLKRRSSKRECPEDQDHAKEEEIELELPVVNDNLLKNKSRSNRQRRSKKKN